MLISRCAWHRRYHGYTKLLGVSSWRGLDVAFTDGICQKCAARVRADHLRARLDRGPAADYRESAWAPGLAAVSLTIVVALVLIARPIHEPPLAPVVSLLPSPAAVEESDPGLAAHDDEGHRAAVSPPSTRILPPGHDDPAPGAVVTLAPQARAFQPEFASARLSAMPRAVVMPVRMHVPRRVPPPRYSAQSP